MGTCGFGDPGGAPYLGCVVLEREEEVKNLNKRGQWPAVQPSTDWGLICGIVLAMLALISMLVFMVNR